MTNIVTELESLDRQFNKYDKITIPLYQRSYAWDGDDVQVFWQDIRESIDENRERYFIGPIVSKAVGDKDVEIIDGQQRITTTLSLISIVRRICNNKFHEDPTVNGDYLRFYETLLGRFILKNSLVSENGSIRYQMNEENNSIYEKFIVADASKLEIEKEIKKFKKTDSNFKLLDSLLSLWKYVEGYIGPDSDLNTLKAIAVYALEKLQILNISVSDESDAYLIFETINDRGRELDTMDLVKNLLFSKVKGNNFEKVKNNWIRMQEHLANMSSANDFLYNFWTSYQGRTSKQNLFSQIKDYIKSPKNSVVEFSNDITNSARVYSAINNPSDGFWDDFSAETRHHLSVLKELSAKVIHPIIMSALNRFDKNEFCKLLRYLVIFQIRYVYIAEYHTGKYSSAASSLPQKINNGDINKAIKVAKELKNEDVYVNDQEFVDAFNVLTCSTKKAKFILSSIEAKNSNELVRVNDDGNIVNIEHILPQEPCSTWSESYSDIGPQEYETWSTRLGNMVLSCKKLNKEAGRKSFSEKKKIIIENSEGFSTTYSINEVSVWNKQEIEKRQKSLAKMALDIWSINFS
ncbi:DUF262 domain-containing HNH endonuclease family protein [Shewanella oncorhynchi]|uniref:DUF262 domain-containing protein n=1 Tax=Shewanella oncorhynchi TaxID=2726434 RepID=UPI002E7B5B2E|nr:DUF262 domain-containing HNH endonuclease family protein [Shewanella oncorhynchi]WVI91527.1 DUF262 domain-containing HNH endonuclease family protein [Shewanella oncorhynchi]